MVIPEIWLAYVNKAEDLAKRRKSEKKRINRERQKEIDKDVVSNVDREIENNIIETKRKTKKGVQPSDDMTELLANFQS